MKREYTLAEEIGRLEGQKEQGHRRINYSTKARIPKLHFHSSILKRSNLK